MNNNQFFTIILTAAVTAFIILGTLYLTGAGNYKGAIDTRWTPQPPEEERIMCNVVCPGQPVREFLCELGKDCPVGSEAVESNVEKDDNSMEGVPIDANVDQP